MIARLAMMAAVLVAALLLATVVVPAFSIGSWAPDVVALTVVAFALADGASTGLRYGFTAGLLLDLLRGPDEIVGLGALTFLLIGYLSGLLRPYLGATPLAGLVAVAGVACGLATLALGVGEGILGPQGPPAAVVLEGTLVVGLYSAAVAPLVCRPVMALSRQLPGTAHATGTGPTGRPG